MVALERAFWRVDRDMVEVDAEPVALGVAIGEKAPLEHLVGRKSDTGHNVGWREGGLLHFREIVVRIAIKLHHSDLDQWILRLRPDLGHVEGIVLMSFRLSLGHHLNEERPARKVARLDRVEQVPAVAFSIPGDKDGGPGVGEVLETLMPTAMKLE